MKYAARACPICGQHDVVKGVASKVRGENQEWSEIGESWRGLFGEKSFFTFARCANCGLLYCPEYFSEQQLGELYASMEANMNELPSTILEKTQLGYFYAIRDYCKSSGDYLELGPDIGYFTRLCSKNGNFASFWLIEPNRTIWPELKSSIISNSGVHLYSDLADVAKIPSGSLTFGAAIHVLDHLIDPLTVLRRIREKMAVNGYFMCVTHDEQSLLARILGARWPAYCLQHPQIYNSRSIIELFNAAGFEVITVRKSVNYFPLGFLLRQGIWATLRLDIKSLKKLDCFNVGLRLGNILTLVKPSIS